MVPRATRHTVVWDTMGHHLSLGRPTVANNMCPLQISNDFGLLFTYDSANGENAPWSPDGGGWGLL